MAITIISSPDFANMYTVMRHLIIEASSNDPDITRMRCRVQVGDSNTLSNPTEDFIVLDPDLDNTAQFTFDVRGIVRDYLKSYDIVTGDQIPALGAMLYPMFASGRTIRCRLTEILTDASGNLVDGGSSAALDFWAINSDVYPTGNNYTLQSSTPGKFLTTLRDAKKVREDEREFISAVLNTEPLGTLQWDDANLDYSLFITTYDQSGAIVDTHREVLSTSNMPRRFDVGVGPANLNQDSSYSGTLINDNVFSYEFYIECKQGAGSHIRISEIRTMEVDRSCVDNAIRLLWLNRLGGLDYFTFISDFRELAIEVQKEQYEKNLPVNYGFEHRGIKTLQSISQEVNSISSRNISRNERFWLGALIEDASAWWDSGGTITAINLVSTAEKVLTREKFNITVEFILSQLNYRQRG